MSEYTGYRDPELVARLGELRRALRHDELTEEQEAALRAEHAELMKVQKAFIAKRIEGLGE